MQLDFKQFNKLTLIMFEKNVKVWIQIEFTIVWLKQDIHAGNLFILTELEQFFKKEWPKIP